MSTSFGKEVGLIHEIIIQARKYGADEMLWKALFDDKQSLVHMIDYASFYHGTSIQIIDGDRLRTIHFVCFSHTDWVSLNEITSRVHRFGQFASDTDLKLACTKLQNLWDMADCPQLQFPIVGLDMGGEWTYYQAIVYGSNGGRPTLTECQIKKQRRIKGIIHWAPGTTFAVVCDKLRSVVDLHRVSSE